MGHELARRFSILHRKSSTYLDQGLREVSLSAGQFMYIMCVLEEPGISQERLCARLRIDKGAASRMIKQLCAMGYLRRERDPRDLRQYHLMPVNKAQAIEQAFAGITAEWEARITGALTPEEGQVLRGLLDKILAAME